MSIFSRKTSASVKLDNTLRDLPLKETNYLINILNRHNCWQELAAVITHPDNSNALLFNSDSIGLPRFITLKETMVKNFGVSTFTLDTKLHKLDELEFNRLIYILNRNDCWRKLVAIIPHPDNINRLLFPSDNDVGVLENQWKCGSSPAEAMLNHWGTSGRKLPDVSDLIHFLKEAGLHRAVSDVKKNLLKEDEDDDDSRTVGNLNQTENNEYEEADIIAKALSDVNIENVTIFSYRDLKDATSDFSVESTIGEGAFGTVYRAVLCDTLVAVKRLKNPVDEQFITELKTLTSYRHENLLPLLGCSLNGPTFCLVYEYMVNGSLQERLACIGNSDPLPWDVRLKIAYGSALGINHLHTSGNTPMVHRDIKSANILLDEDLVPKVGDFGLVRIGNSSNSTLMPVTENVYGTNVYMAYEAFRGDVSIKLDTFSFGVVLLELITGLPPIDDRREDRDLISHMQGCEDILPMLDPNAEWNPSAGKELYEISKRCLKETKRERPTISQILGDLEACLSHIPEQ